MASASSTQKYTFHILCDRFASAVECRPRRRLGDHEVMLVAMENAEVGRVAVELVVGEADAVAVVVRRGDDVGHEENRRTAGDGCHAGHSIAAPRIARSQKPGGILGGLTTPARRR